MNTIDRVPILSSIVNSGVSHDYPYDFKRQIVLINQVSLMFSVVAIPYFFIFYWLGLRWMAVSVVPFVVGFLMAIVFNSFRLHYFSKWNLVMVSNLALLFYDTMLGYQSGINFIFFSLVIIPFVLFKPHEKLELYFGFFLPVCLTLVSNVLGYYGHTGVIPLTSDYLWLIRGTITVVTFVMLVFSVRFYYNANHRIAHSLEVALNDLRLSNTQLSNTNASLSDAVNELQKSANVIQSLTQQAVLGAIIRGIVHEVKSPLTSIRAICSLILTDNSLTPSVHADVEKVLSHTRHLSDLTKTLLADSGSIVWMDSPIDLKKLIGQVLGLVENEGFIRQIRIDQFIPDDIPVVKGAAAYISQALINLLVNAIRFSPDNSVIEVRVTLEPEWVVIYVRDFGSGISPEIHNSLFNEGVTTSAPGSSNVGLGLYFVKRVLDAHNGVIKIHDTSADGTTFAMYLPVDRGSSA
ncbi:sensor histidine kinase [bacterium]|nr:sensor histidine kinase [bacterium]